MDGRGFGDVGVDLAVGIAGTVAEVFEDGGDECEQFLNGRDAGLGVDATHADGAGDPPECIGELRVGFGECEGVVRCLRIGPVLEDAALDEFEAGFEGDARNDEAALDFVFGHGAQKVAKLLEVAEGLVGFEEAQAFGGGDAHDFGDVSRVCLGGVGGPAGERSEGIGDGGPAAQDRGDGSKRWIRAEEVGAELNDGGAEAVGGIGEDGVVLGVGEGVFASGVSPDVGQGLFDVEVVVVTEAAFVGHDLFGVGDG